MSMREIHGVSTKDSKRGFYAYGYLTTTKKQITYTSVTKVSTSKELFRAIDLVETPPLFTSISI